MRTLPGFSSSPTGAQTILSTRSASKAATCGTGSSQARASSAALQESSRVALTPFIDVDDQRDASVKRGSSFVEVSSTAAISEFSLSQIFFAEGPPSVLRGRGPPSGIFVALIDDARRRFSLSNRAEASARIFALRSWGVSGTCKVGGVQKETRSFVRIANAGFVADADLMRSRRSAASALGGLGGVVGMVSLSFAAADGLYGASGGVGAAFYVATTFYEALVVSFVFGASATSARP